uniref:ATP synthase B chain n=1 Tax=Rhabditophanes sp. KR3021 TaxID=114890 RepID=A0AC35TSD4_9BILA
MFERMDELAQIADNLKVAVEKEIEDRVRLEQEAEIRRQEGKVSDVFYKVLESSKKTAIDEAAASDKLKSEMGETLAKLQDYKNYAATIINYLDGNAEMN